MPKAARSNAESLSALVVEIEAEAYARGRADAKKELLDLLGAGGKRAGVGSETRGRRAGKASSPRRRAGGGRRAPKGSVRPFVERVLREHPGSTAPEIHGHAAGDGERRIKLVSIRNELRSGGTQGRYVSYDGRWSLAVSEAHLPGLEDAPSSEPSPVSAPDEAVKESAVSVEESAATASGTGEEESRRTLGLNL